MASVLLVSISFAPADTLAMPIDKDEAPGVEKEDVVFEMLLPVRDLTIPENEPGSSSAFIALGLRITNRTNKPLRFNGYNTLYPELITADGHVVHRLEQQQGSRRHRQPQESDFPLVEPGKSTTIALQADLFRPMPEQSTLTFRWWLASGAPGQYFDDLKTGRYKLRLVYQNQFKALEVESPKHIVLDDNVWTGRINTTYAPVLLRESRKFDLR